MNGHDLPPPLARRWGGLAHIRRRSRYEWSSECPRCRDDGHDYRKGPPDRFHMHYGDGGSPRGACRRCGYFSFADEGVEDPPTPDELAAYRLAALKRKRSEEQARQALLSALDRDRWYEKFAANMDADARLLWQQAGVPDELQVRLSLGYTDRKPYSYMDELYYSPALTIPYFGPGWKPLNVQYRLLDPVEGAGKYRPTAGLLMPVYLTDPDEDLSGELLVVEGAKKAIVTYLTMVLQGNITRWKVVGLPAKEVSPYQAEMLAPASTIWVLLDPDAGESPIGDSMLGKVVDTLGRERCYTVCLPAKVDDMIMAGQLSGRQLMERLLTARKA